MSIQEPGDTECVECKSYNVGETYCKECVDELKLEMAKQIFEELDVVKSGDVYEDFIEWEEYQKIKAKFLQEIEK